MFIFAHFSGQNYCHSNSNCIVDAVDCKIYYLVFDWNSCADVRLEHSNISECFLKSTVNILEHLHKRPAILDWHIWHPSLQYQPHNNGHDPLNLCTIEVHLSHPLENKFILNQRIIERNNLLIPNFLESIVITKLPGTRPSRLVYSQHKSEIEKSFLLSKKNQWNICVFPNIWSHKHMLEMDLFKHTNTHRDNTFWSFPHSYIETKWMPLLTYTQRNTKIWTRCIQRSLEYVIT